MRYSAVAFCNGVFGERHGNFLSCKNYCLTRVEDVLCGGEAMNILVSLPGNNPSAVHTLEGAKQVGHTQGISQPFAVTFACFS